MNLLAKLMSVFLIVSTTHTMAQAKTQTREVASSPIVWFELHVKSFDQSYQFYSQLFGWTCQMTSATSCNIVQAETQIGEIIEKKSDDQGSAVLIYFPVDDLTSVYNKATSLGAQTVYPPMNLPGGSAGSIAVFKDLEGIPIGIFSSKPLPNSP